MSGVVRVRGVLVVLIAVATSVALPRHARAEVERPNRYRLALGLGAQAIGDGGGNAVVVGAAFGRRVTRWLEADAILDAAVGAGGGEVGAHAFVGVGVRIHPLPRLYLGLAAGIDDIWSTDDLDDRGRGPVAALRPALGAILYPGRRLNVGLEAALAFTVLPADDTFYREERILAGVTLQLDWR